MKIRRSILLAFVLLSLLPVSAPAQDKTQSKEKTVPNPYADANKQAINTLNQSLSSIGTCVVVTVESSGKKDAKEYLALIPDSKYSPKVNIKESIPAGILDVTGRINEAVEQAKKNNNGKASFTITIERKVPKSIK